MTYSPLRDGPNFHTHEQLVLLQIHRFGGFTDWWISENLHRVAALEKLIEKGVVVRVHNDAPSAHYPFAEYRIVEQSKRRFIDLRHDGSEA